MTWDPDSYLRFGDERTRPSVDLAARVALGAPATVIDLGCGPGNSTQVLRERWPQAQVTGLDSSQKMIETARAEHPDQQWLLGRIEQWEPAAPFDVVFSNAALQWIPNHAHLVQRLFAQVAPGGALAFQVPSGQYAPLRVLIDEVSRDPAWDARLEPARSVLTMESPAVYYDALAPHASSIDMWETEYHHVLDSPQAIVEWISSTGLRPFLGALDSARERERFVAMLNERVAAAYERRCDGRVLFGFKRIFVIAYG